MATTKKKTVKKKATKATKKNVSAATKYKNQMNTLKKQYQKNKKLLNDFKKHPNYPNSKGTINALKKNMTKIKKKYDRAKSNYSSEKQKTAKSDKLKKTRKDLNAKVKKDPRFKTHAYISPNNPGSTSSYVFIYVKDQSATHGSSIASQAVEEGMNMSTTSQMNAPTISITGTIGGRQKDTISSLTKEVEKLERWADSGIDMKWHGKRVYSHVQISDFTSDLNFEGTGTGINSTDVSMTLQIGNYFNSKKKAKKKATKDTGTKTPKTGSKSANGKQKATAKKGNKSNDKNDNGKSKTHKYIVAKRGYTYWYISQKTGVKLSVVRKLNKYPDREIPIGSKIYYS